jgi:hypothetical protein
MARLLLLHKLQEMGTPADNAAASFTINTGEETSFEGMFDYL